MSVHQPNCLGNKLNTGYQQKMQEQTHKNTWFDTLLYYLFSIKLSLKLTLIFQFVFILLFAVSSLAIGIHLFYLVPNVSFTAYNYGDISDCQAKLGNNQFCEVTIQVRNKLEPPNFISNSKDYINSRSNTQLYGNEIVMHTKQARKCHPYITNKQMGVTKSWTGVDLNPDAVASPCGLQAKLFFKDQFQLWNQTHKFEMSYPESSRQFTRVPNSQTTQWLDPTQNKFQIWMTTSINKTVSKLYGTVNEPMNIGNYTFKIKNNMNYSIFQTRKNVKIMKINNEFGNNVLLGLLFVGGGTCLFIISLLRFVYDLTNLRKVR